MNRSLNAEGDILMTQSIHASLSHTVPGEINTEDEDGLELPVNPDEGTPLAPNEQGEITAPT